MKAAAHPRQSERLAALRSYDILDTPRESDFDDIVELASSLCDVPIAVVNLIDAERQWFKAEIGIGASETPLETSICSHIILEQDFTMIEDTHLDPRTSDNELCQPADGLRFYAGSLLKSEEGLPIGTLCVLDTKPKTLNEFQKQALTVLARRVMRELELRRALKAQQVLRDEIDHRVKNSLASISGAMRLYKNEARKTGDVDGAFDALQRQIDSVTAIHKAIYLSDEDETLDLKLYMDSLCQHLSQSLPESLSLRVDAPEIMVAPELARTVGLIANEFAANTLKHGDITDHSDEIDYVLRVEGNNLILSCRNNVPERRVDLSDDKPSGIGERLMRASVAQNGGTLDQHSTDTGFELVVTLTL